MKEAQIAKLFIKNSKDFILPKKRLLAMEIHKSSCERFLKFLKRDMMDFMNINGACFRIMNKKITDLQNAIKIYKENGI